MVIPYILAFFAVFKISGGDITHEGVGGFFRAMFIIAGFFGGAAAGGRCWPSSSTFSAAASARAHADDQPCRRPYHRDTGYLHDTFNIL